MKLESPNFVRMLISRHPLVAMIFYPKDRTSRPQRRKTGGHGGLRSPNVLHNVQCCSTYRHLPHTERSRLQQLLESIETDDELPAVGLAFVI